MRNVFVDGYNVIHTWTELKELKDYSFEASRQKFIDYLQNYATFRGYKVYLVFDAHMVSGSIQKKDKISDNLNVIYLRKGKRQITS